MVTSVVSLAFLSYLVVVRGANQIGLCSPTFRNCCRLEPGNAEWHAQLGALRLAMGPKGSMWRRMEDVYPASCVGVKKWVSSGRNAEVWKSSLAMMNLYHRTRVLPAVYGSWNLEIVKRSQG